MGSERVNEGIIEGITSIGFKLQENFSMNGLAILFLRQVSEKLE